MATPSNPLNPICSAGRGGTSQENTCRQMHLLPMHKRSDILAGDLAAMLLSKVKPISGRDGEDWSLSDISPFYLISSKELVITSNAEPLQR